MLRAIERGAKKRHRVRVAVDNGQHWLADFAIVEQASRIPPALVPARPLYSRSIVHLTVEKIRAGYHEQAYADAFSLKRLDGADRLVHHRPDSEHA